MTTLSKDPATATAAERWARPTAWRKAREVGVYAFLLACAAITVLTTAGIVVVLGVQAAAFFGKPGVSILDFLFGTTLDPEAMPPRFGILPLAWGTLVIAAGSSVIALPIGLLSAIYLSEYAPRSVRAVLKPTLELLAGIPTIVYGYLGPPAGHARPEGGAVHGRAEGRDVQRPERLHRGRDHDHPDGLVAERGRALGRPSGVARGGVRPRARRSSRSRRGSCCRRGSRGSSASFILAISRAIGETMAVVLAAGLKPQITLNPLKSIETMTAYIVAVTRRRRRRRTRPRVSRCSRSGWPCSLITLAS